MSTFSKQITAFCDTTKCEYFDYKQHYINNWNTGQIQPSGKTYICRHPSKGNDTIIVELKCPKMKEHK